MSADAAVRSTDLPALLTELAGQPTGRAGSQRWHCITPQHTDEDPSTTVFEDSTGKERWKCWSCGHAGTAIDALVEARSMTVADAISHLEQRTGTADVNEAPPRQPRPKAGPVPLSGDANDYLNECARLLWTRHGTNARSWLHERGLTNDVLETNLVGFDPGPRFLDRAEGLPGNQTERPRLPRGGGIVYVSFDRAGDPIHVQCRLLRPGNTKYINPRRLHGSIPPVSFPRTSITDGPVVVTEGISDGLIAVTAGFRSAAITAATTVRPETATELVAHAGGERIVLAIDNDTGGQSATTALKELLGQQASVLRLPTDHDLTDTYNRRTSPSWQHPTPQRHAATR